MEAKKFFIVGPAWVGDMVMAQTLFKVIMRRYPKSQIDVFAPSWTKPLLDRMPEVNKAIESPFHHGQLQFAKRHAFAKTLRNEYYDRAIILKNSFKSALIPFWAKIPSRTGWRGEMRYGLINDLRKLDKKKFPLMIQRFMALGLPTHAKVPVSSLIYPRLNVTEDQLSKTRMALNLGMPEVPVLALCPGAEYGPAKRWPAEHFAAVANEKLSQGWAVWLFGSHKDQAITQEIQQKTNNRCLDLAGKTSLNNAIDLLSLASFVVTNDSGLMHVASALDRPVAAVYGSSSPEFTPPLSNKVDILNLNMACSPCFKRTCPFDHLKCLRELKPSLVLASIEKLAQPVVTVSC